MTEQDFTVWRGNSYRVVGWSFPFPLEGSDIRLTIAWRGGSFSRSLNDGGLQVESTEVNGETVPVVWFQPTVEESRLIGANAKYEVERIVPDVEQRTYVRGSVLLEGGLNVD